METEPFARGRASDLADQRRDHYVEQIEDQRQEIGMKTSEINDRLDKPRSWFQNRKRGEDHKFTIFDINLLMAFFQLKEDYSIRQIEEAARSKSEKQVEKIRDLREDHDVSRRRIEEMLDKNHQWFDEEFDHETHFRDYCEMISFFDELDRLDQARI